MFNLIHEITRFLNNRARVIVTLVILTFVVIPLGLFGLNVFGFPGAIPWFGLVPAAAVLVLWMRQPAVIVAFFATWQDIGPKVRNAVSFGIICDIVLAFVAWAVPWSAASSLVPIAYLAIIGYALTFVADDGKHIRIARWGFLAIFAVTVISVCYYGAWFDSSIDFSKTTASGAWEWLTTNWVWIVSVLGIAGMIALCVKYSAIRGIVKVVAVVGILVFGALVGWGIYLGYSDANEASSVSESGYSLSLGNKQKVQVTGVSGDEFTGLTITFVPAPGSEYPYSGTLHVKRSGNTCQGTLEEEGGGVSWFYQIRSQQCATITSVTFVADAEVAPSPKYVGDQLNIKIRKES